MGRNRSRKRSWSKQETSGDGGGRRSDGVEALEKSETPGKDRQEEEKLACRQFGPALSGEWFKASIFCPASDFQRRRLAMDTVTNFLARVIASGRGIPAARPAVIAAE